MITRSMLYTTSNDPSENAARALAYWHVYTECILYEGGHGKYAVMVPGEEPIYNAWRWERTTPGVLRTLLDAKERR